MKISSFTVSAFALALIVAGFVAGWTLGYQQPPFSPAQEVAGGVEQKGSTTGAEPTMPAEDVSGDDVPDLPRYPGSVRIEHTQEDLGGLTATEVEYLTPTGLDTVREFYRDAFRTEEWNVADVSFSEGAWTFFVTRQEREVFVEIKPYGDLTEVDFELTEPKPEKEAPQGGEPQSERPKGEDPPAAAEPGPQPPARASPASASPVPSPAPAYDDDFEYDDDD